jgi:carboxypeptidase T
VRGRLGLGGLVLSVLGTAASSVVVAPAAAADFPPADSGYHNYSEMVAQIHAVAMAHPDIVQVFSIGKSYKGRDIWAAKVSKNVSEDEDEPEVLFDGGHHAREHITVEQTLYILDMLVDGYGGDQRVTDVVDGREIWIVFNLNPDGSEYDLTGDPYRAWRKNRQPTPGSSKIGTDLNRNYDYRWGCCGGSSGNAKSLTYRGWKPFSAPETRVIRDLVQSRVIGGWQQIRTHITFHSNGKLVLWPYGYTKADVPSDMSKNDHAAFVVMGKKMASLNGYTAKQSSGLYITDGDQIDWLYGRQRIFSYTFELYPAEHYTIADFYPPDEILARETARNRSAVLYLIEQAACPWRAAGLADANCGAFYDDLELAHGWRRNAQGTDTASDGGWERGNPEPTSAHGPKQLGTAASAARALVTGRRAGSSANANDVDGGLTSITSPAIALPATPGRLTFRYYFAHGDNATSADRFRAVVMADDGDHVVFTEQGASNDDDAAWTSASIDIGAFGGQTIRVRFEALDAAGSSLVEAAVDDVRVRRP